MLAAARGVIELQDVGFTGNSAYDDNGRFFINNPSPIDYISVTPEVDEAWNNLTLSNSMALNFYPGLRNPGESVCIVPTNSWAFLNSMRLSHFRRRG